MKRVGHTPYKTIEAAERLRAEVLKGIAEQRLAAGDRIQSERELARKLDVSYITLRRALGALVEEGLLERRPYKGIFVGAGAQRLERAQRLTGSARQARRVRGLLYLSELSAMYAQLHSAIAAAMDKAGVDMVWSMIQDVLRPEFITGIKTWDDDAFVIVGDLPGPVLQALEQSGRPLLLVDIDAEGPLLHAADNAVLDNEGATFDAATRFFERGHARVAYAGSVIGPQHPYFNSRRPREWPNSVRRGMGVRRAYVTRGITPEERLFARVDHSQGARELAQLWFGHEAQGERPTAVVCFDGVIAAALLQVAAEHGVTSPRDFAVVCVGEPDRTAAAPALTHYAFDWRSLGHEAAELCLARLQNPALTARRVVLPWRYVQGETTERI